MKEILWTGDTRKVLRGFPKEVRSDIGVELNEVQLGRQPADSKPMPSIGPGVEEIRVWDESGTYRVIYIARLPEAVYVLHAFQKKAQQTSRKDLELSRARLRRLLEDRN